METETDLLLIDLTYEELYAITGDGSPWCDTRGTKGREND